MKRYVGKYQLAPGAVFTVSVNEDQLMVSLTGQPTFRVYPRSDTKWFYKVVDATLTFKVDRSGRCNSVELFQNGVRQKAKRIE
jgi:D-alanyl-D-alanine-carboxypeptidase/D-alanyl-D-alanine-endopeptidase